MFSLYYYYHVYYMMYSHNAINQYICTVIVLHIYYYKDTLCLDYHMILARHA